MDLTKVSTQELEEEIEQRKWRRANENRITSTPSPDFSQLIEMVTGGVAEIEKKGYEDEDFKQYVYEAVLEAMYGPRFWQWLSKVTRGR